MTALPRVGDDFGRYRIDARLGEGSMGVVYLATDTVMGRQVALKVVSSELGDSPEFQARFEREAAVLARLDSPHVIAIYQYGAEEACPYIATQYVAGGDLGALLAARGPMPPTLALGVCAQIADALHDAHRVGVVHRDVKPTNVLLRDPRAADLHAYLCDFGIARTVADGLTTPGSVAGTWRYLSPECGKGAAATPSSDLYSLGCLLWATLTGRAPFQGTDVEIAVAHQAAPIPRFEDGEPLTAALNEILRRTMAKQPSDRYADAETLREALAAAGELPATVLRPVPPTNAPRRPPLVAPPPGPGGTTMAPGSPPASRSRRRRRVAAVAGLVALGAVVATALVITTGDPDPTPSPDPTTAAGGSPTSAAPTGETAPSPTSGASDPPGLPERRDARGPVTGDLDGDGLGDVALLYQRVPQDDESAGGALVDVTEFRSDGGAFTVGQTTSDDPPPGFLQETTFGDLDGDELLERLTVRVADTLDGPLRLTAELSGGGSLDAEVERPVDASIRAVGIADVDGDRDDDVLLQLTEADRDEERQGPGPVSLVAIVVEGDSAAAPEPFFETSAEGADMTVGDFDGDGLGDVAVVVAEVDPDPRDDADDPDTIEREVPHDVRLFLNDGDGGTTPGPATTYASAFVPSVLGADLDGDEDLELVIVGYRSGTDIAALDLDGRRFTGPEVLADFRSPGLRTAVTVADVDGDGLDDLVAAAVVGAGRTRVLAARSSPSGGLSVSRWALWDRLLDAPGFDYAIDFLGRPVP